MTEIQHDAIMQALALLAKQNGKLKELLLDVVADISDLQARIETVNMRFDE